MMIDAAPDLSRSGVFASTGFLQDGDSRHLGESPMSDPDELPVLEGYDAWAPLYDDDGNPLIAIEGPAMLGWFGVLEGRRALDIGCGTGRHTLALASSGASVAAIDGSMEMMARARFKLRGYPIDWARHHLPDPLPFADSTFDLIVLGLVAEHIQNLSKVLNEAARVARPGGHCLLSALHPDRTALGQRARFIDPRTGLRRHLPTIHRTVEEYLTIAEGSGWSLVEERSLVVPAELGETLPRATPYIGQRLGWAACWRKV
jgi:SAM-dependent methyltransferase